MEAIREFFKKLRSSSSNGPSVDEQLETPEEYYARWRSIRIIYFTMFLMSLAFSIVLTGIWPFLNKIDHTAGKEFLGLVVGANPLGQMIFSPAFGYWSNKAGSIRFPLYASLTLFSIASATYSSLEAIPSYRKYWMLGSRFLIGVSSANTAVCRSYLSAATKVSERTQAVSMVSLAQVLGFIVGPALQAAVTPLGEKGFSFISNKINLNMYTAAGWINVLMGIINLIMFLPAIFKETNIATKEAMVMQGKDLNDVAWKNLKPNYLSAWTLIVAFFVLVFNFVLLETLGTPLTMEQFAWTEKEALYYMGLLMSVGAVIACLTFVGINPMCKLFEERYILIWGGFSFMVLGRLLYIPWGDSPPKIAEIYDETMFQGNETIAMDSYEFRGCPRTQEWCLTTPAITLTQFLIGYAFTSIGYPVGVTLIQTIFSKTLGPRPQGVWMGLMTGAGCFSRVMGPVFVGYIYTKYGTYWTFGITGLMMMAAMIALWILREHLIPQTYDKPSIELQDVKTHSNKTDLIQESDQLLKTEGELPIIVPKKQNNNTVEEVT